MPKEFLSTVEAMQLQQISMFAGPLQNCLHFIKADQLPAQNRIGLLTTLDLLHNEIQRIKQEAEAIQPLG